MKWLSLSEPTKDRLASLARFIVLIPMVILGNLVRLYVQGVWADYWLSKDPKTVSALVTQTYPKQMFDYRYTVDGKEYTGTSKRDWEAEKVHALQVGETTPVLVSASHPWFSSLQTWRLRWLAFPFIVLVLLLEFFLLVVLIDPNGRWPVGRWLLGRQDERAR